MTRPDDFCGCPVTAARPAAAVSRLGRHGPRRSSPTAPRRPSTCRDAAGSAPDFALGHAAQGSVLPAARPRRDGRDRARRTGRGAGRRRARAADPARGRAIVAALGDWLGGQPGARGGAARPGARRQAARRAGDEAGAGDPVRHRPPGRDARLGRSGCCRPGPTTRRAATCSAATPSRSRRPATTPPPKRTGREGVELAPDDAWGLHAVAHVYDMTGRARDGLDWLTGREASWAHCNNFRYHVWWHLALMHLDLGDVRRGAGALRRRDPRAKRPTTTATSPTPPRCWRGSRLEGVAVGDRWDELADLAERRATDGCLAFADLHYMLALCRRRARRPPIAADRPDAGDAARAGEAQDASSRTPACTSPQGLHALAQRRIRPAPSCTCGAGARRPADASAAATRSATSSSASPSRRRCAPAASTPPSALLARAQPPPRRRGRLRRRAGRALIARLRAAQPGRRGVTAGRGQRPAARPPARLLPRPRRCSSS